MPKLIPPRDWTVATKELCELLGIGSTVLARLRRAGMPREARGEYRLDLVIPWLSAYWQGRAGLGDEEEAPVTVENARRLLLIQQAKRTEIEVKTLQGDLIPVEEVHHALQEVATITRGGLEALPVRAAAALPGLTPDAIERELDAECRYILEQIGERVEAFAVDLEDSESLSAAPEEGRRAVG